MIKRKYGCDGKVAFASRSMAERVQDRRRKRGRRGGAYKCRDCHQWHLGVQFRPRS